MTPWCWHERTGCLLIQGDRGPRGGPAGARGGRLDTATSRAYYAAFYAATAALIASGEQAPRTHKGLHDVFARRFVLTGQAPAQAGRTLKALAAARERATYDALTPFDVGAAHDFVSDAEAFVGMAAGLVR